MKSIILIGLICCIASGICQSKSERQRPERYRDRYSERYGDRYDEDFDPYGYGGGRRDRYGEDRYEDEAPGPSSGPNRKIPNRREDERDEYHSTETVLEFAMKLFKHSNKGEDFVLSPLSPHILLSYLTWAANGQTRRELKDANGFGTPRALQRLVRNMLSDPAPNRELNIATAFFVSKDMPINNEFKKGAEGHAEVVDVDFKQSEEASRAITRWTTSKTKGGLKLNPVSYPESTKIAMLSAIYFKGKFVYTFQPSKPGIFNSPSGPIPVQNMNMKQEFRYGKMHDVAEWVAMPYEGNDALVIILPFQNTTIDAVIEGLEYQYFRTILHGLDRDETKAKVNITLPKFKLSSFTNLVEPLKKMGVKNLFEPNAELPYLSNSQDIQVSNAQQQSSMDVNEEGTVLISVTQVYAIALTVQRTIPKVNFTVDRPFIAMIANAKENFPYVLAKITHPKYD